MLEAELTCSKWWLVERACFSHGNGLTQNKSLTGDRFFLGRAQVRMSMIRLTENQSLSANYLKLLMMMALSSDGIHQMMDFKKIWQPLIKHRSLVLGAILISLVWTTLFFS